MKKPLIIVFISFVFSQVLVLGIESEVAQQTLSNQKEFKTTDEIVKLAASASHGEDHYSSAQFKSGEVRVFAIWFNPYRGIRTNHVHIYVFRKDKKVWMNSFSKKIADGFIDVGFDSLHVIVRSGKKEVAKVKAYFD